jgi:hypothetical protein
MLFLQLLSLFQPTQPSPDQWYNHKWYNNDPETPSRPAKYLRWMNSVLDTVGGMPAANWLGVSFNKQMIE